MGLFFSSQEDPGQKYIKLMQQQNEYWEEKYKRLEEQKNELEKKLNELLNEIKSKDLSINVTKTTLKSTNKHRLSDEVERVVQDHLTNSLANDLEKWQLVYSDTNNIKVYRREVIEDGIICDPLKAVCTVKGITGYEMCNYFWQTSYRLEWEGIVDSLQMINDLNADDTIIVYELLKKHWASAQRDVCFWSHIRNFTSGDDASSWIVVNYSTEHDEAPKKSPIVRANVNIALICTTKIDPNVDRNSRDSLTCEITYVAYINPGGWVPGPIFRELTKKECSNFIQRFSKYFQDKTAQKDILFTDKVTVLN